MINSICNLDECIGCFLCENICSKNAISLNASTGFYKPVVNDSCIECNLCRKVCPVNNTDRVEESKYEKASEAIAAWSNDDIVHKNSTSGGVAYTLSKKIVENGGFAVSVWFNSKSHIVEYNIFESTNLLKSIQGSKYVHSYKGDIYKQTIEKLRIKQGIFVGTPCEVYAMRVYYENERKKKDVLLKPLYFIDLLCRGGSSPLCFNEHIAKLSKNFDGVTFRGGKFDCQLTLWKGSKLVYQDGQFLDPYFKLFMRHTLLQPACFSCKFCGSKRVGDMTIGDFWGLSEKVEKQNNIQGINMVLVNNERGKKLLSFLEDFTLIHRPVEEAINGNETLQCPTHKEKEYDGLWIEIRKKGFHKAIKKIYGIDWRKRYVKMKIKLVLKKILRKV